MSDFTDALKADRERPLGDDRYYLVAVDLKTGDVSACPVDPDEAPLLRAVGEVTIENQGVDPEDISDSACDALRALLPDVGEY